MGGGGRGQELAVLRLEGEEVEVTVGGDCLEAAACAQQRGQGDLDDGKAAVEGGSALGVLHCLATARRTPCCY